MMISIIRLLLADAGWSSLVARWAHNPKVAGSNPAPATKPFSNYLLANSLQGELKLVESSSNLLSNK
jgi:hypothetical protein